MLLIRLIILIILPALTWAETITLTLNSETVRQQLSCYEEELQTLELITPQKNYLFEVPFFLSTPVINTNVVCRKFIGELPNHLKTKDIQLSLELKPLPNKPEHYQLLNTDLIRSCSELQYCWRDVIDYIGSSPKIKSCYPRPSLLALLKSWKPDLKKTQIALIPEVELELFPFMPLNEKLKQYRGGGDIYASTMNLGGGTLKNYAEIFNKSSDRLFLMLDAGLLFSTGQSTLFTTSVTPYGQILAVPMTSGRFFETIHHWKFVVNQQTNASTLSSMNITTPDKTNYLDVLYNFKDPEIKRELQQLFFRAANSQCQAQADFECLSEFSSLNRRENRQLRDMIDRSCQELAKEEMTPIKESHFLEPNTADLEYVFRQMVKSAKKEVIIITHKFKLESLYQELLAAKARGVKVYLFVTANTGFETKDDGIIYQTRSNKNIRQIPDPHMKVMLIDREKLWFGTGNFSHNAFHSASELFAQTNSAKAIKQVLEIAANLHASFAPIISNHFQIAPPATNWLLLQEESTNNFAKYADPEPDKPWLKRYLKIKQEFQPQLKKCALDHLLIVPEKEILRCLDSLKGEDALRNFNLKNPIT